MHALGSWGKMLKISPAELESTTYGRHDLTPNSRLFESLDRRFFSPRTGNSICNRSHSPIIADHYFDNTYMGKQPPVYSGTTPQVTSLRHELDF